MASKLRAQRTPGQGYGHNTTYDAASSYVDANGMRQTFGNGGQPTDYDKPMGTNVDSTVQATSPERVGTSNNSFARQSGFTGGAGPAFSLAPPPGRTAIQGEAGFGQPEAKGDRIASVNLPVENQPWVNQLQRWKLDSGYTRTQ